MIHFYTVTSFTPWWDRFCLAWSNRWKIVEYGDGDFVIYQNMGIFGYVKTHATGNLEDACAWCEKQVNDSTVKRVTYAMGG